MEEKELLEKCLKLDPIACKELYDKNAPWLLAICRRYSSDLDQANDMLQDGFILIFEKLHTYNGKGDLNAWMRRVVVNVALGYFRKKDSRPDSIRLEDYHYSSVLDVELLQLIDLEEIITYVNGLSEGRKQVFNAFVIEGYSHKEVAEMMGISEGTSKSQLHDAKREIQKAIEKDLARAKKRC